MTTADGTCVTHVLCQVAHEKLQANAPTVIPRYNNAMQAVDLIDQLMQLFSLTWHHKHKKWYKELKMALWDMAIANGDIHFHEQNPQKKIKYQCYVYHNNLGYGLINTNWAEFVNQAKVRKL
eukprot:6437985-Ditylum_brightwellii.AAC.1